MVLRAGRGQRLCLRATTAPRRLPQPHSQAALRCAASQSRARHADLEADLLAAPGAAGCGLGLASAAAAVQGGATAAAGGGTFSSGALAAAAARLQERFEAHVAAVERGALVQLSGGHSAEWLAVLGQARRRGREARA